MSTSSQAEAVLLSFKQSAGDSVRRNKGVRLLAARKSGKRVSQISCPTNNYRRTVYGLRS